MASLVMLLCHSSTMGSLAIPRAAWSKTSVTRIRVPRKMVSVADVWICEDVAADELFTHVDDSLQRYPQLDQCFLSHLQSLTPVYVQSEHKSRRADETGSTILLCRALYRYDSHIPSQRCCVE
jgi:hypothetical protein